MNDVDINEKLLKFKGISKTRSLNKKERLELFNLLGTDSESNKLVNDMMNEICKEQKIVRNVELKGNETIKEINEKFIKDEIIEDSMINENVRIEE